MSPVTISATIATAPRSFLSPPVCPLMSWTHRAVLTDAPFGGGSVGPPQDPSSRHSLAMVPEPGRSRRRPSRCLCQHLPQTSGSPGPSPFGASLSISPPLPAAAEWLKTASTGQGVDAAAWTASGAEAVVLCARSRIEEVTLFVWVSGRTGMCVCVYACVCVCVCVCV